MKSVLVDTNVVSYLFRNDTRARLYQPHLSGSVLNMSFMTVTELDYWMVKYNWGEVRRSQLEAYILKFVVIPFTRELGRKWAEVTVNRERVGKPISAADAWIAATALLYDIPMVTHNRKDFEGIDGLAVISEG